MTPRIFRIRQLTETTQLGRSTIYFLIKKGEFPPPIKLGERASGWLADDICAWIEKRRNHTTGKGV